MSRLRTRVSSARSWCVHPRSRAPSPRPGETRANPTPFGDLLQVGDGSKAVQVGSAVAILGEEGDDFSESAIKALVDEAAPSQSGEPKEESKQEKSEPKKEEEQPKKADESSAPKKSEPKKEEGGLELSSDRPVILATPMAKRLALEQGVPLAKVKGTGPEGRITKEDVEKFKASTPAAAATAGPAAAAKASPAAGAGAAYVDTPVSNMRRVIAGRLTESKSSTPHYYLTVEINMDRVNKLREAFNTAAKAADAAGSGAAKDGVKGGVKLSVNDFIVKASALALQDVPEVNSGWHGDFIRQYETQDVCVAVATPNGLITPIIADAGRKGLATISSQAKALAGKARDGKLKPEEYQGGSFTISNLGMMGIDSFTAIINPPQSCILAIGTSEKKLVLDPTAEKGFKEVNVMKATLSCDHRVVDGAVGARWMKAFKSYLEVRSPFRLWFSWDPPLTSPFACCSPRSRSCCKLALASRCLAVRLRTTLDSPLPSQPFWTSRRLSFLFPFLGQIHPMFSFSSLST